MREGSVAELGVECDEGGLGCSLRGEGTAGLLPRDRFDLLAPTGTQRSAVEEGCITKFISRLLSADHRSTVTRKKEQSTSLRRLVSVEIEDQDGSRLLDIHDGIVFFSDDHFSYDSRS